MCWQPRIAGVLMVESAEKIREQFAKALREALVTHFGRLPAASILAREFNLRAYGVEAISQESARRWLRGLSMPSQDKLGILQSWLSLDLNLILRSQSGPKDGLADRATHEARRKRFEPTPSREPSDDGGLSKMMLLMLDRLSNSERVFMLDLMGLLASRADRSITNPPIRLESHPSNGAANSTSSPRSKPRESPLG